MSTANQGQSVNGGKMAILGLDVWEHAIIFYINGKGLNMSKIMAVNYSKWAIIIPMCLVVPLKVRKKLLEPRGQLLMEDGRIQKSLVKILKWGLFNLPAGFGY